MEDVLNWNRAATSADPFPGVEEAMVEGLHALPASRGATGQTTAERIFAIRERAARMFGFSHPERVVFTSGATFGLNQAVHGGIEDGAHVLTTAYEHNAVTRPLRAAEARGVSSEVVPFDRAGRLRLDLLAEKLAEGRTQWLAIGMAANTYGVVQPFEEACALAREHGVRVLLDMAQGGGQVPVSLDDLGVSYAAVAGHKSLHGPRGVGLLFVGPDERPRPLVQGGTGTEGTLVEMPEDLPGRLEAGTKNFPGVFGLGAALEWLEAHPPELDSMRANMKSLESWCREHPALEVLPPEPVAWEQRLAVLALKPVGIAPAVLVDYLAQAGVGVRSGSMCTARVLPAFDATEGLIRLSPPLEADASEYARVREALEEALTALS